LQRVEIGELQAVAAGRRAQLERTAVFSRPEGLPTPQCTSGHGSLCCRDASGGLWFALAAGAVRAPASPLPARHAPLKLNIESVSAGGRLLWQHDSAGDSPRLDLTAPLRSLELRFTAPSFTAPDKLRFRYRMGGMDDAWQEAPGSRVATYSSLAPGNFRFEVAAAYPGEPWTTPPASVVVVIRPRFWQTTLFKTTAAVLIAAGVAMLARHRALLRIQRRLSALERERKLDAERSRIARDLHDDLGATLTEIGFLGTSGAAAAQSAGNRERLEAIVARARRMAKSLDEIVWTVNPDNDTLSSVVNYLCSRTEESLRAAGVRCRLEVAEDLPRATLDSEIRHHLLMAVNEAVNNVMKHAGANEARLRIRHGDGELELTVSDDGCGFDPAAVSPDRNGLRNLGARLAAIGGRFTVDSAPGAGTRIALAIPLIPRRRTAAHPPAWGAGQTSRSV
jgi:signal transduction histidine kinase